MATSVFLAKLIGPVLVVAMISLFVNTAGYRAMAQEFLRSPALIYLSGVLAMIAGLAIVLSHNVWVANWPVLITLLGWLAVIGGAVRITVPDFTRKFGDTVLRNENTLRIFGAGWLAIGAILTFFGYFRNLVR
jgi:uncharacterized protein YjeT (DUF2065 family)